MTSSESHNSSANSNVVEVDGICFETLVPERMYRLPKYEEETPIQFGMSITNNSSTPYRFHLLNFLPEILDPHGKPMHRGFAQNSTRKVKESDIPLIMPGESLEYLMKATLSWNSRNCLELKGYAGYGGIWWFYNFKSTKYQIRLLYKNLQQKQDLLMVTGTDKVDGFWTGYIATPFARLVLR